MTGAFCPPLVRQRRVAKGDGDEPEKVGPVRVVRVQPLRIAVRGGCGFPVLIGVIKHARVPVRPGQGDAVNRILCQRALQVVVEGIELLAYGQIQFVHVGLTLDGLQLREGVGLTTGGEHGHQRHKTGQAALHGLTATPPPCSSVW